MVRAVPKAIQTRWTTPTPMQVRWAIVKRKGDSCLLSFLIKGVASSASSSSSAVPDELAAAAVVIEPYAAADVDATVITKIYD
jgi:hypothetical protein